MPVPSHSGHEVWRMGWNVQTMAVRMRRATVSVRGPGRRVSDRGWPFGRKAGGGQRARPEVQEAFPSLFAGPPPRPAPPNPRSPTTPPAPPYPPSPPQSSCQPQGCLTLPERARHTASTPSRAWPPLRAAQFRCLCSFQGTSEGDLHWPRNQHRPHGGQGTLMTPGVI